METGIRERASIIKAAKPVSLLNDRCDSSHRFNPATDHTVGVRGVLKERRLRVSCLRCEEAEQLLSRMSGNRSAP